MDECDFAVVVEVACGKSVRETEPVNLGTSVVMTVDGVTRADTDAIGAGATVNLNGLVLGRRADE